VKSEKRPHGSYAWPCGVVGCHRRAPTHTMICLRCLYGGTLPKRLGAWAWRQAAKRALATLEAAFVQPGDLLPRDWPPSRRPDPSEVAHALRRVARCYRSAAWAARCEAPVREASCRGRRTPAWACP
jgi:hypothetical protein